MSEYDEADDYYETMDDYYESTAKHAAKAINPNLNSQEIWEQLHMFLSRLKSLQDDGCAIHRGASTIDDIDPWLLTLNNEWICSTALSAYFGITQKDLDQFKHGFSAHRTIDIDIERGG